MGRKAARGKPRGRGRACGRGWMPSGGGGLLTLAFTALCSAAAGGTYAYSHRGAGGRTLTIGTRFRLRLCDLPEIWWRWQRWIWGRPFTVSRGGWRMGSAAAGSAVGVPWVSLLGAASCQAIRGECLVPPAWRGAGRKRFCAVDHQGVRLQAPTCITRLGSWCRVCPRRRRYRGRNGSAGPISRACCAEAIGPSRSPGRFRRCWWARQAEEPEGAD
jgi:hypothetical protein